MKHRRVDNAINDLARVNDEELSNPAIDQTLFEMRESIVATPSGRPATKPSVYAATRRSRHKRTAGLALATATLGVLFAVAMIAIDDKSPGGQTEAAWAAEDIALAEKSPLLLMPAPYWNVTYADEQPDGGWGEMSFSRGGSEANLFWRPARLHGGYVDDRAGDANRLSDVTIAGNTARIYRYNPPPGTASNVGTVDENERTEDAFTALWRAGDLSLEFTMTVRGADSQTRLERFVAAARSLRGVGQIAWLEAMPATVVLPGSFDETARAMLSDIPAPPNYDYRRRIKDMRISDRYQFGAAVVGGASCAWLQEWVNARRAGDTTALQNARRALKGFRNWKTVSEMSATGAYWQVFAGYVAALDSDGVIPNTDGSLTIENSMVNGLGCPKA